MRIHKFLGIFELTRKFEQSVIFSIRNRIWPYEKNDKMLKFSGKCKFIRKLSNLLHKKATMGLWEKWQNAQISWSIQNNQEAEHSIIFPVRNLSWLYEKNDRMPKKLGHIKFTKSTLQEKWQSAQFLGNLGGNEKKRK